MKMQRHFPRLSPPQLLVWVARKNRVISHRASIPSGARGNTITIEQFRLVITPYLAQKLFDRMSFSEFKMMPPIACIVLPVSLILLLANVSISPLVPLFAAAIMLLGWLSKIARARQEACNQRNPAYCLLDHLHPEQEHLVRKFIQDHLHSKHISRDELDSLAQEMQYPDFSRKFWDLAQANKPPLR